MSAKRMAAAAIVALAGMMTLQTNAHAQDASVYGPGKVWCASQAVCHLHVSDSEDYGFNGLTLTPVQQQALLGGCQISKDCVAKVAGDEMPHVHLLNNARIVEWIHAPAGFGRSVAPSSVPLPMVKHH